MGLKNAVGREPTFEIMELKAASPSRADVLAMVRVCLYPETRLFTTTLTGRMSRLFLSWPTCQFQSARSYNLHQPDGLTSPSTTLHSLAGAIAQPSRRVMSKDIIVGFGGLVAGKAATERRLVGGFAIEKLREPPAAGRGVLP